MGDFSTDWLQGVAEGAIVEVDQSRQDRETQRPVRVRGTAHENVPESGGEVEEYGAPNRDDDDSRYDLIVVGGGMAGMAAARTAVSLDARVIVLEAGTRVGGSAVLSAGGIWTAADYESLRRHVPLAEPVLAEALVEDFGHAVRWLRDDGVTLRGPRLSRLGWGTAHDADMPALMDTWSDRIHDGGGTIRTSTRVRSLKLGASGRVSGVLTQSSRGPAEVRGDWVLLASGGFQGDLGLRTAYLGPGADEMPLRGNPYSVGDGFRMGREAGAATSRGMGAFYGHLVPSPLTRFDPPDFFKLAQFHSRNSILVNRLGRRFVNEGLGDEHSAQAALRQPEGRAVLLIDDGNRQRHEVPDHKLRGAMDYGARFLAAESYDDLILGVAEWGLPAENLRVTLARYVAEGRGDAAELDAPIPKPPTPLENPPFFALEVQPAITFCHGGLAINVDAQVLDLARRPIPGLLAAGADAGGIHNVAYAGGLASAMVFGRRAARAAMGAS